ncbi:MAG: DUF2470 domain-containing protein [Candidatus Limnocylindria bacterium]
MARAITIPRPPPCGTYADIARALAGYPEATAASAEAVDRFGLDLRVATPTGDALVRVDFAEPIPEDDYPDGVRVAFVRLARRARTTS